MQTSEDQAVINRVLDGEVEAFRLLIERYQGPLFGMLSNLLPAAECEDIAQETFIAAFDNLGKYKASRAQFSTWLFTIARNKSLNFLQKSRPQAMADPPEKADWHTPEKELSQREWFQRLDQALAELPPEQQAVFVLAEIQELSYEQVGQIEGI